MPLTAQKVAAGSEEEKWNTLLFHGKNYVLSPDDFISYSTSIDESTLSTAVSIQALPPWISGLSSDLKNSSQYFHGMAAAEFDLLAKIGVRRYQTQELFNIYWPSQATGSRFLSYTAAAILARINAQADSGTMQVSQRPDMQLGRTLIDPMRWKSYYILGITNSWSPGSPHVTTLNVSYGHPMHKTLDTPWGAVFSEPEVFGLTTDSINKLVGISKNGLNNVQTTKKEKRNPNDLELAQVT